MKLMKQNDIILVFMFLMWFMAFLASGTITVLIILALLRYITGCG